jgi:branched-chain amino acid transport system ATP-binding protein
VRENITLAALAREGNVFSMWAPARGNGETNTKVQGYITDAGMDPVAETKACELSHGKRRQLEISMAMASSPHMLLLDEPMAGMGHKEGHDMLHMLSGLKGRITTLLVEHDMDIVFSLADTITVLAAGKVIASGAPEYISKHPEVKRVYLGEGE